MSSLTHSLHVVMNDLEQERILKSESEPELAFDGEELANAA